MVFPHVHYVLEFAQSGRILHHLAEPLGHYLDEVLHVFLKDCLDLLDYRIKGFFDILCFFFQKMSILVDFTVDLFLVEATYLFVKNVAHQYL